MAEYAKLSGQHSSTVHDAVFHPAKDCVISIGDDRMIICWLRRDNGHFWPSISQQLPTVPTALEFHGPSRRLFVGLENGTILGYTFSEDFNNMQLQHTVPAHSARVSAIAVDMERQWLLSCARDKSFAVHNSLTATAISKHRIEAWFSTLQYDSNTQNAFAGDFRGNIHVLKITDGKVTPINILTGHSGSIRCLLWAPSAGFLFSGSFDKNIVAWDIGGQKGRMLELCYHTDIVQGLVYLDATKELVSCDENSVVVWNMAADRKEAPEWEESDVCQLCGDPFMWNFSEMWAKKSLGTRQHHCRLCGKAICAKCSPNPSTYPALGYERVVPMCTKCSPTITPEMKKTLIREVGHKRIALMHGVPNSDFVVVVMKDNSVLLWHEGDLIDASPSARPAAVPMSAAAAAAIPSGTRTVAAVGMPVAPSKPKANLIDSIMDE